MKPVLLIIGIVALAAGLLFMGQGSGYFPWPERSFMINQSSWIYYGGGLALVGIILIVISRR
jgi:hypothetical protein